MNVPDVTVSAASETDWFGTLPAGWRVDRLKYAFERVQRPYQGEAETVTAFRDGVVTRRSNRRTDGFTEADKYIGYQGIEPGDLAIHAMDGFAGAIGVSDSAGKCSPVVSVCKAINRSSPDYYAHVLRLVSKSGYLTAISKGVRERSTDFRWADARELSVPYPPADTQRQIIAFLDRETAQIDELIGKQNALIALLGERRKAVITRAVTKGLDPDASTKPSGNSWFAEIPTHWQVVPLKRNLRYLTSGSRGWAEYYSLTGTPFIRVGNLPHVGSALEMADTQYVEVPPDSEGSRTRVRSGDVLFSITGAHLGLVAVVTGEQAGSYVSQHVALCRVASGALDPTYFSFVVQSDAGQRQIQELGYSGTKPQLALSDVSSFMHTLPPLAEQIAINQMLGRATRDIDGLIDKARRGTQLLLERRAALITAAVTGKIDVRGEPNGAA